MLLDKNGPTLNLKKISACISCGRIELSKVLKTIFKALILSFVFSIFRTSYSETTEGKISDK